MPVLGLDAVAKGPYQSSEFLGYDNRPMPTAAAQDMDVHTVRVGQSQERQGTVEAAFDERAGARGGQDVVAYVGVEAVGLQHPLPHGMVFWWVAQAPGIDAECVATRSILVAVAVARDDGPDQGRDGLGA